MTIPTERDHISLRREGGAVFAQTVKAKSYRVLQARNMMSVIFGIHFTILFSDKIIQKCRRPLPFLDCHSMHSRHPFIADLMLIIHIEVNAERTAFEQQPKLGSQLSRNFFVLLSVFVLWTHFELL